MKKLVCLLLAVLLLAACAGAALADISAVYRNGKVTVSTSEGGFWEITIDTEWTGRWVGTGMNQTTFSMKLEEGEHQVIIFNPDTGQQQSAAFQAGAGSDVSAPPADPAGAPQPAVTDVPPSGGGAEAQGPVRLSGVTYAKGVVKFRANGIRGYAEVWLDGRNTGLVLTENGAQSLVKLLRRGDHTLAVYLPTSNEMDSVSFFAADFIPDAEAQREAAQGVVVKDRAGETVDSVITVDMDETGCLLCVSAENGAVLILPKEQVKALLDQGLNMAEYGNGKSALRVDLTKITDAWFDAQAPVTAYCFVLDDGDDGTRVNVYAAAEAGDAEAETLTGVTLIREDQRVIVKRNGVY